MRISWLDKLKTLADHNRPRSKPQLWEDVGLSFRRRLQFEVRNRLNPGWMDAPHLIELSNAGFEDGQPALRMEVIPKDVLSRALFLYGTFEISEIRLLQSFLRSGMTLVDVGANVGYHSVIGARLVGKAGAVFCFEPNDAIRKRLEHNIELNGFENVVVRSEAMAGQSGHLRFYLSAVPENSGISSIVPGAGLVTGGEVIESVSLDDFARQVAPKRIDLLKMDIEGAELQVLEGGRDVLSRADAPALLFESFNLPPILSVLSGLRYQVRRVHYRLDAGLELPGAQEPLKSLFAGYESPNYFAVKDPDIFDAVIERANSKRSSSLRFLGRF